MGLRIGTPDAEATITTRSARLDPGYSTSAGRRSSRGPPPDSCVSPVRASAIDRPSRAPASPLRAAVPHPRRRSRRRSRPRSPAAASRYSAAAAGARPPAPRAPCGSSPVADRGQPGRRPGHHAVRGTERLQGQAARRGRRRRAPAPGAAVPPVTRLGQQREPSRHVGPRSRDVPARARRRGRPPRARAAGPVPAAGRVRQTPSSRPVPRRPARHRPVPDRRPPSPSARRSGAPSSAADARAARRLASAAVAGHPRRFAGWWCSATTRVAGPFDGRRPPRAAPPSGRADLSGRHSAMVPRQC